MGACTFTDIGRGKTAVEAFANARKEAQWQYGHGGYTGSLAEKPSFVLISVPADKDPREYANELLDVGDERIDDKWGPAGCIKLDDDKFLFFGWASS